MPAGLRSTISSSLNFLFLKSASRGLAEKGYCNSAMSRSAKFLSLAQEKKNEKMCLMDLPQKSLPFHTLSQNCSIYLYF